MKQVQKIDGRLDGFRAQHAIRAKNKNHLFRWFSFIFGGLYKFQRHLFKDVKEAL